MRSPLPAAGRRHHRIALALALAGCTAPQPTATGHAPAPTPTAEPCDPTPRPASSSPGVPAGLRRAAHWIEALGDRADTPLLDAAGIEALNRSHAAVPDAIADPLAPAAPPPERVDADLAARQAYLAGKIGAGDYLEGEAGVLDRAAGIVATATPVDELRAIATSTPLWCIPATGGIYTPARDLAFDRNRCSTLHPGELVRVLRREGPWHHVLAAQGVGWVRAPAWTPPLGIEIAARHRDPPRRAVVVVDGVEARPEDGGPPRALRVGTAFPDLGPDPHAPDRRRIELPTTAGLVPATVAASGVHEGWLPFTRRNLLELAFAQLEQPYGWGGHGGGRDCSRFVHDLWAAFGIVMARNSAVQAELGSKRVDLRGLSEADKRARIAALAREGVVLLYMRGHIMIYLGEHEGRPYALSSLSEYLEPCPGHPEGPEAIFRLDRVEVTTLELGRGTSRTAFIERIERAIVFGGAPPAP